MADKPYIFDIEKFGDDSEGYLSVIHGNSDIPFSIARAFLTWETPLDVRRGKHAHHKTQMVLIAANGEIHVETETLDGEKAQFILNSPDKGLYLPALCWHTMRYSPGAVQLVLTSTRYDANDYIRSYDKFLELANRK